MASAVIELKNASVHFGETRVFDGISLSVKKEESLVLVGPSGQGKTTLLKLMAGLIEPQAGKVFLEDQDLANISAKARGRLTQKVGMLFQKNALFDSLSAFDNVAFPLREVRGAPEHEIKDRVEYFLEAVGLEHAANLLPHEISGGMQKRLGIARALILEPTILFYDDPTAGLDPITSKKIIQLILELREKNRATLVTVTNDMNRAFQLADRIAMVIDRGLIETGSRAETLAAEDARVHQFVRGLLVGPLSVVT